MPRHTDGIRVALTYYHDGDLTVLMPASCTLQFFSLGIYIENLTEYVCHTPLDVFELLKMGQRKLIFAETKMNRRSSR